MVASRLHPALAAYLARNNAGHGVQHPDGSVHLVFDNQYRIAFIASLNGGLLLEARVSELASDDGTRRSKLTLLLERAGRNFASDTTSLALSRNGQVLVAQQFIPAEAAVPDLERSLEQFINLLASYRSLAGVL